MLRVVFVSCEDSDSGIIYGKGHTHDDASEVGIQDPFLVIRLSVDLIEMCTEVTDNCLVVVRPLPV